MVTVSGNPARLTDTLHNLPRELRVLGRSAGIGGETEDGFFISGTLLQAYVLANYGLENLVAKHFPNLLIDIPRNVGTFVVQGHDDTEQLQLRVGTRADALQRLEQVIRPFERVIRRL